MNEILRFLIRYCSFLYEERGYRFVDSYSHGGDGVILLASERLRIKFIMDRRQLFADFQAGDGSGRWYSIDLFRRIVVPGVSYSSVMNEDQVGFLREYIGEIEDMFSPSRAQASITELDKQRKIRGKEMFG